MTPILLGILGYVLAQLAIGVVVARGIKSEADYLLAGRRLGPGLATFSVFATWFGAETCIGAAGAIYEDGLAGGYADPFGYAACLFLMGFVFAIPLWRRGLTTLADLFRQRYSIGIERLAVIIIVPTSIMWAAAQIRAFGQVLDVGSPLGVDIAITIAATVVIVYTIAGGLYSDVITDLIQGIALIIGLVVLFYVVAQAAGGFGPALAEIPPDRLRLFGAPDEPLLATIEKWAIPITGSVVAQELVARILAVRSPTLARRASIAGGGMYLVFGLIPVFIGLIGARLLPDLAEPEQLLPTLAQQHLSTVLYILFAGALISAILSTVDSALLAAAALVEHNLILPLRPNLSERGKIRVARLGVLVAGIIAYVLALHAEGVYELVVESSAFGGAGIFVIVVFGLFTTFGGARAAGTALVVGIVSWVAGGYWFEWSTPYLISLGLGALGYVLVALFEGPLARSARA